MHVFVTPPRLFAFVLSLTFQKDIHPRNVLMEMIDPSHLDSDPQTPCISAISE